MMAIVDDAVWDFPGGPVVKIQALTEGGTGLILVGELKFHMLCCAAKKNNKKQKAILNTGNGARER